MERQTEMEKGPQRAPGTARDAGPPIGHPAGFAARCRPSMIEFFRSC